MVLMQRMVTEMEKFRFRPFDRYADPTRENMEKLNSIRSLYYAHDDSGIPPQEFAVEFYRSVGDILLGKPLEDPAPAHVQFDR